MGQNMRLENINWINNFTFIFIGLILKKLKFEFIIIERLDIKIINKMTDATIDELLLDSKLVGCMIRNLPSNVLKKSKNEFHYVNCLDREYLTEPNNIASVTFDISRYGKYTHTIKFPKLVCEKEAIEKIEKYLSKLLTQDYYEKIVNDLFHEAPWAKAKTWFVTRGDCLTDCKFLEDSRIINGNLTLWMGS